MRGHLKPEAFVNLIEGIPSSEKDRLHLERCDRCSTTWKAMESTHTDFASIGSTADDIIEPDWNEFRSSVRDELLSRSVQRSTAVWRWTGWRFRPAMAWSLSTVLALGITTGAILWHRQGPAQLPAALTELSANDPAGETDVEMERSAWSQTGIFEELAQLGDVEEENLREMILAVEPETPEQQ